MCWSLHFNSTVKSLQTMPRWFIKDCTTASHNDMIQIDFYLVTARVQTVTKKQPATIIQPQPPSGGSPPAVFFLFFSWAMEAAPTSTFCSLTASPKHIHSYTCTHTIRTGRIFLHPVWSTLGSREAPSEVVWNAQ